MSLAAPFVLGTVVVALALYAWRPDRAAGRPAAVRTGWSSRLRARGRAS